MEGTISNNLLSWIRDLANRRCVIFVSKDDAQQNPDGTLGNPFPTFTEALLRAAQLNPTGTKPLAVYCLDGATYEEQMIVPANVRVHADDACVSQTDPTPGKHAVTLDTNAHVRLRQAEIFGDNQGCVVRIDSPGLARAYVGTCLVRGGTFSGAVGNIGSSSVLFARVETIRLQAPGNFGLIEIPSEDVGHLHAEIGDLYTEADNCVGIARLTPGTTLARVEHMIEVGTLTGNIALYVTDGEVDVNILRSEWAATALVDAPGVLNAIIANHSGSVSGTGTHNILTP